MAMIVPTSSPPSGETVEATFNSMGFRQADREHPSR